MQKKVVAGIEVNDSPRLKDGSRAMFVRVLDKRGTKKCIDMLQELNPQAPGVIEDNKVSIYAPDGDLVLSAMPTDERKAFFVCRLHKEVFAQ